MLVRCDILFQQKEYLSDKVVKVVAAFLPEDLSKATVDLEQGIVVYIRKALTLMTLNRNQA